MNNTNNKMDIEKMYDNSLNEEIINYSYNIIKTDKQYLEQNQKTNVETFPETKTSFKTKIYGYNPYLSKCTE